LGNLPDKKIGVLALQGDFYEHISILKKLDNNAILIKKPEELESLDGLIIPGGESTTICKLIRNYGFEEKIKKAVSKGMGLWGTCAGMITIAKKLKDDYPKPIDIMDITVERNFYGRQIDSFEEEVLIKGLDDKKFNAIFIRAPIIREIGKNVEVLSMLNNEIIAARQEKIFVTSFHPELTEDSRVHEYFLNMC
jgi:5'-phosphate synthase pdxT subunit